MPYRKKLIEAALPINATNTESTREKSTRASMVDLQESKLDDNALG